MNLLVVDDEIYAIEGIRLLLDWKKNGIDNIFDAASIAEAKDIFSREKIGRGEWSRFIGMDE